MPYLNRILGICQKVVGSKRQIYCIETSKIILYMCILYNNMYSRIKNTIESLQGKRQGITPSVDKFLRLHGDENITQFIISRNVLNPVLTTAIGLLSPSFARKTQDTPLYHLKILIRTTKSAINVEKNERISFGRYRTGGNDENLPVYIPNGLTLNILMARTRALMGNKFLSYSASSNNCQNFILAILQSSNLANPQNTLFVKQATQSLFTPELRKISNTITDIAGGIDIIKQGGRIL
jgi:hypothetical protein